ncbi:uncharacterized protein LOC101897536 [Musca domestica]|uniref:Regulatory protein zeste n=1 Tax=Musca domestica TaxID=7370 RepID=A0ABM3VJY9_MUSDO|nr:uncharacterized protein LOC101897536 [Musca domestica]
MNRKTSRGTSYKKTTNRQYSVLIREIGKHLASAPKSKGDHYLFWCELRDKLNCLGPPTRTITEWKKVWNDCQRSRKRRELLRETLRKTKVEPIEVRDEPIYDDRGEAIDMYNDFHEVEKEELETDNMYTNECSQSSQDMPHNFDDSVSSFIISEANDSSFEQPVIQRPLPPLYRCPSTVSTPSPAAPPPPPPPLPQISHVYPIATSTAFNHFVVNTTPKTNDPNVANSSPAAGVSLSSSFNQDIFQVLKNQMIHQTKLLEHMSRVSNNMAQLMERQVTAIEKQTEAVRRQAIAMEHHTLVMNSFVDMIRDKMPKTNSNNRTANSGHNGKS